jgi:hypothetical protein
MKTCTHCISIFDGFVSSFSLGINADSLYELHIILPHQEPRICLRAACLSQFLLPAFEHMYVKLRRFPQRMRRCCLKSRALRIVRNARSLLMHSGSQTKGQTANKDIPNRPIPIVPAPYPAHEALSAKPKCSKEL